MTAMQILERCRQAESDKCALRSKITRYRESTTRITATLDGIGARGTSEPDRLGAMVGEIDALERRLKLRGREHAAELAAATLLLEMLPESECKLLTGYYVENRSMAAMARKMNYSYGYTRNLMARAREHVERIGDAAVGELLPRWYLQLRKKCCESCSDAKDCPK